jgi:hypothetical protein
MYKNKEKKKETHKHTHLLNNCVKTSNLKVYQIPFSPFLRHFDKKKYCLWNPLIPWFQTPHPMKFMDQVYGPSLF